MTNTSPTFSDSKKHYVILDALRGVAAILVVMFHILETFTNGDHSKQIINHGYLAVDFFFLLSGFVIGYAYDDRWGKMGLAGFFKRRLIRLHPMIIAGMLIGAVTFYFQDCSFFPAIAGTPLWKVILVLLIGLTLFPVTTALDIRGWQEMYPLNGPAWSLFFEYVANILYALIFRRISKLLLFLFVLAAAAALIHLAVTGGHGDIIGGWSLEPEQLRIGITRLLYPFFAGLLLYRAAKLTKVNNAFLLCSLLLIAVLSVPRVGGNDRLWMNGLYDSLCVILLFPLIVYLGASGEVKGKLAGRMAKFLGDISYPLYITHYPFIYMFMTWVAKNEAWIKTSSGFIVMVLIAAGVFAAALLVAYACLKLYDVPVRKWLMGKIKV